VAEAFPNLTSEERERLAAHGIDVERSFRDWLACLVGPDKVEQVIEDAAARPELRLPDDPTVLSSVRPSMVHGTDRAWRHGCRSDPCVQVQRRNRAAQWAETGR
jgi:hypothetical protein